MSIESDSKNFWSMCMCVNAFNSAVNFVKRVFGLKSNNDITNTISDDAISKISETSSNSSSFVTAPCESTTMSFDASSFSTAPEESTDIVSCEIEKISLSKNCNKKLPDLSY